MDGARLQEVLEANRNGRLDPSQRRSHERRVRRFRRTAWILLLVTLAFFNVYTAARGIPSHAIALVIVEVLFLVIASIAPLLMWWSTRSILDDLERGEVASTEGVIDSVRDGVNLYGLRTGAYFVHIGGLRFYVGDRALARAAMVDRDRKARVRINYLPKSQHVLSIEPVRSPPPST